MLFTCYISIVSLVLSIIVNAARPGTPEPLRPKYGGNINDGGFSKGLYNAFYNLWTETPKTEPLINVKNKDNDAKISADFWVQGVEVSMREFRVMVKSSGAAVLDSWVTAGGFKADNMALPFSGEFNITNVRSDEHGKAVDGDPNVAVCRMNLSYAEVKDYQEVDFQSGEDYLPKCPKKCGVDFVCTGINGVKSITCPESEKSPKEGSQEPEKDDDDDDSDADEEGGGLDKEVAKDKPVILFQNKKKKADVKVDFWLSDQKEALQDFKVAIDDLIPKGLMSRKKKKKKAGKHKDDVGVDSELEEADNLSTPFRFNVTNVQSDSEGEPAAGLGLAECQLVVDLNVVKKTRTVKFQAGDDYLPDCPNGVNIVCTGATDVNSISCGVTSAIEEEELPLQDSDMSGEDESEAGPSTEIADPAEEQLKQEDLRDCPVITLKNKHKKADVKAEFLLQGVEGPVHEFEISVANGNQPVLTSWTNYEEKAPKEDDENRKKKREDASNTRYQFTPREESTIENIIPLDRLIKYFNITNVLLDGEGQPINGADPARCRIFVNNNPEQVKESTIKFQSGDDYLLNCDEEKGIRVICNGPRPSGCKRGGGSRRQMLTERGRDDIENLENYSDRSY